MVKIAVIGTAGRRDDGPKLSRELYFRMVHDAEKQIKSQCSPPYDLVSGGAAYADQIAVSLYLMDKADSLTLYFPCGWNHNNGGFVDITMNGKYQTAKTANYYHRLFSEKMGGNTLDGIQKAIDKGATYHEIEGGFKARNLRVAEAADVVLAYTFGTGNVPKDGGTSHTWNASKAKVKIHRRIQDL